MSIIPSFETLAQLAREGKLPTGFDQWTLSDENGFSAAHGACK